MKKQFKLRFAPLKSEIIPRRFGVFDIETMMYPAEDKGKFLFGGVYIAGNYEVFTDREKMKSFLTSRTFRGFTFFAHNLEYDMNRIFLDDENLERYYIGSRLVFAKYGQAESEYSDAKNGKVYSHAHTIWYFDSAGISGYQPLSKIGDMLGIPKMETDYYAQEITAEYIEYNRRDCEITYKFVDQFQKTINALGGNLSASAAGCALDLFRRKFMSDECGYWPIPEYRLDKIQEAYYGGRTEVFNFNKFSELRYYDINSSYPFAMLQDMPILDTWKNGVNIDKDGITLAEVRIDNAEYYPPLPYRAGKLFFPVGRWKAYFTNIELRTMNELCPGMSFRTIGGWHYDLSFPIFEDYINALYVKKRDAKNPVEKNIFKLLMNSLYGKFGQHSRLEIIRGSKKEIIDEPKAYANIIWSAQITSIARINLYKMIRSTNAVYCDTDSSMTEATLETSKEIGGIDLKETLFDFEARGNKFYYYTDKDGNRVEKIKGVSASAKKISPLVYSFERPIKYKGALLKGIDQISTWVEIVKTLNTVYDKRDRTESGDSIPRNVDDLRNDPLLKELSDARERLAEIRIAKSGGENHRRNPRIERQETGLAAPGTRTA
jgi:hypothetical protein